MKKTSGYSQGSSKAKTKDHISDLGYSMVTQQLFHIMLSQSHHDTNNYCQHTYDHQHQSDPFIESKNISTYPEHEVYTKQFINRGRKEGCR